MPPLFKLYMEGFKGIISFDFDSTLTKPALQDDMWEPTDEPHSENHELMKKYAKDGYKVIIVTSRNELEKKEVEEFVRRHNLPVSEVYATNGEKGTTLARLGVIKHHDDVEQQYEDPNGVFDGEWVKIFHPADGY